MGSSHQLVDVGIGTVLSYDVVLLLTCFCLFMAIRLLVSLLITFAKKGCEQILFTWPIVLGLRFLDKVATSLPLERLLCTFRSLKV